MQLNKNSHQLNQSIGMSESLASLANNTEPVKHFIGEFSPVQLNTILSHHQQVKHAYNQNQIVEEYEQLDSEDNDVVVINSNSIVRRYQLMLIACLILASIASVVFSTKGTFSHIKKMTDYFNYSLLGNQNLSLYEDGDNIDQPKVEISNFQDMRDHFNDLFDVIEEFNGDEGFTQFVLQEQKNIKVEIHTKQRQFETHQFSKGQLQLYFASKNMRDFILNLQQMRLSIQFGTNKKVQNMELILHYITYSHQMLEVNLKIQYIPNDQYAINRNDEAIRIVEQVLALFLLCSYLHNAYKIESENSKLRMLNMFYNDVKTLQNNRSFWCFSLVSLNLVTIFSGTLAPLTSFLQLLPIFQRHDSATSHYNFNANLRYAIPIVLRILIPVILMLNGFIFYSLLMYPGQYFDSYVLGFFSYIYQNFQVGTYEIFQQLKRRGNFAYFLYSILYFYMVLVGNNLYPALFCTLIYIKMSQKDLKRHIKKTINTAVCPQCNCKHFVKKEDKSNFQININSPKISPYLKGKLSSNSAKSQSDSKPQTTTKMFVQEEQQIQINQYMKTRHAKIKMLSQQLKKIVNDKNIAPIQLKQMKQKLKKARIFIQQKQESLY